MSSTLPQTPRMSAEHHLSIIDTLMFDVDGVFTDNRTMLFPGIDPVRIFHTRDAYAVQHAVKEGMRIVILTGGRSQGVAESFARLGVQAFHSSVPDKSAKLDELIASIGVDPRRAAYMGDDIPDIRIMQRVLLPSCPSDAVEEVKAVSAFVSPYRGGHGCVRDLIERTLKMQGKWMTENAHTW